VKLFVPRLRLVLLLAVVLSVLVVVSIVSWFFAVQYREEATVHMQHYAFTVAANVASAETDSIITENFASLQDSLASFQKQVHVVSITITTPEGVVLADTRPERLGEVVAVPAGAEIQADRGNTHTDSSTGLTTSFLPIRVGETSIGWCIVVLDTGYIQDALASMQKKIILVTAVALLVMGVVIFFFSAAITRPLEDMMVLATEVADGNFEQQARVAGVFEIRKLAEVFNMMSRAIKEREQRLRQVQKMEAVGMLSASIAHEFGNPLMGIGFLLRDLRKNPCLDDNSRELLDMGLEECDRMKKLVRDLKLFYRPSSGKAVLVELQPLIENILVFQKSFLDSKKVAVVREFCPDLPPVHAVPDQIKQVLVNLLLNGVEAMEETGGTVTICTGTDGRTVRVSVHDTGRGIPAGDMEKIFLPFFTTKPEVDGTGLGLSVSYGIIKNHGGEITVTSEPGQGTTFTLVLPVAAQST
jgi:signal transduction histidine kinase